MYITRWGNFDKMFDDNFAELDQLRRRMNVLFRDFDPQEANSPRRHASGKYSSNGWPRTNLYDDGSTLILYATVPGMSEKDIDIQATADVLSISGERKLSTPQGYSAHRQERGGVKFSRSFALPTRIDVEKTTAAVKNGMLIVRLTKAQEATPHRIAVKAWL